MRDVKLGLFLQLSAVLLPFSLSSPSASYTELGEHVALHFPPPHLMTPLLPSHPQHPHVEPVYLL